MINADNLAKEEFNDIIFGNTIMLRVATGAGLLSLKKESLRKTKETSSLRAVEKNLKVFDIGFYIGKKQFACALIIFEHVHALGKHQIFTFRARESSK